jgi:hypothetical protein
MKKNQITLDELIKEVMPLLPPFPRVSSIPVFKHWDVKDYENNIKGYKMHWSELKNYSSMSK